MDADSKTPQRFRKQLQQTVPVPVIPEKVSPFVVASDDVITPSRYLNARRAARERQAVEMQNIDKPDEGAPDALLPMLDEAISHLAQSDHEAIVLRFLRQETFHGVGSALGVSEDAAEKRVARAVERLRVYFKRRGLQTLPPLLAGALGVAGSQAAPAGMSALVATGSLAAGAAAGTASSGLVKLIHSLFAQLAAMKTQWIATSIVVAGLSGTAYWQQRNIADLRSENAAASAQIAGLPNLEQERRQLEANQALADEIQTLKQNHAELLHLHQEAAQLKASQSAQQAAWQKKLAEAEAAATGAQTRADTLETEKNFRDQRRRVMNDLKQLALAARIYANDNKNAYPTDFSQLTNHLQGIDLEPYEFVPQPRPVQENEPDLIVFREKQPRRIPDGTWQRAYAMVDGHSQTVGSPNGDFTKFEKEHTAAPPGGPMRIDPVLLRPYGLPAAPTQPRP